jgi:hypothetical protein
MRLILITGALAGLLCSGAARAGVVENFTVEDWGGLAYADDTTGKIANCSVYASNQKGATLLFIKNADESWFFSLTDDDWKLTPSSEYPVRYKIDGRRTVEDEALALSDTQLGILLPDDAPFFGQVRRGNRLTVTFQDESYPFDLADSGQALDAAEACLERHKESDAQTAAAAPEEDAPAAQEQAASDEPAAPDEQEAEAEVAEAPAQDTPPAAGEEPSPAAVSLPAFGNVQIEAIEVPGWEAAAFADEAGVFTHCAIRAEYENGTILAFARTADGSLIMGLAREDWGIEPGNWLPIRYSYKGGEMPIEVTGEAQAVAANLVAVNMGKDDMFLDQLKAAPEIAVEAEGKSLTFDIGDVAPGLQAIDSCREKHGAAPDPAASSSKKKAPSSKKVTQAAPEADAAPAETEPAIEEPGAAESAAEAVAPEGGTDAADIKAEAADFTTSLLARSGYDDHTMLTGDDVPESMRDRASTWQIGEIMGVTDIVGGSLAEIREQLEASDRKDCAGTFTHAVAEAAEGEGAHVFSTCKSPSLNLNIHYVILPREAEGFYLLSLIAFADGTAVESIAAKVLETARAG